METHYVIFTVRIPPFFKFLDWKCDIFIVKILTVKGNKKYDSWQRLIIIVIYWKKSHTSLYSPFNNPMKQTHRKSLGIVLLGHYNNQFQVRLRPWFFEMSFNVNSILVCQDVWAYSYRLEGKNSVMKTLTKQELFRK